jgi:hypothetical protein
MGTLTPAEFLFAWAVDTAAAVAVFLHASRHGSKHATAWGAFVFLALIVGLPAYLIHARRSRRA